MYKNFVNEIDSPFCKSQMRHDIWHSKTFFDNFVLHRHMHAYARINEIKLETKFQIGLILGLKG